ncbi:SRPBCC family protein [Gloeocapsa sp. PCC 73106]|uniref:SRPBCC family protein n=1 Tax=Gloeocapsa sp. PCC 73106 TaxID=102232 RepID=UPI0002AC373E|nr:SRPBCC family protein [Gloeocapsa sp. PCC 73106]ELR97876.1 Polyketide cyclase / dehydrase and lipid transport [Gloeocapsa sp. PCC 73106]
MSKVFEQAIAIQAKPQVVEHCLTDQTLMHRWLNPLLSCEAIGEWSTELNSRSRFKINLPFWQPALESKVIAREDGLIMWEFQGFFQGRDRWECQPIPEGTLLVNRFEFTIPNPLVSFGFNLFAASLTKKDMEAQLKRVKIIAEVLESSKSNHDD